MIHTQQKSPNLWLVIAAATAILLITIGMRMTLGLFVRPVVDSTELSIQEFSLIIAVFQLMWGVSQPLSGALADRFGAFKVLGGGALLLVCACLMVPQMPTYWGLMLAIGLLFAFGTGAGGFSIIMGQVAAKVPPHKRGLASGLVNAGGSAGQFLFAPLVQGLLVLPAVGWTGTFYVWGGIALLILPISWWLAGGKNAVATHHTSSENGQSIFRRRFVKHDKPLLAIHGSIIPDVHCPLPPNRATAIPIRPAAAFAAQRHKARPVAGGASIYPPVG